MGTKQQYQRGEGSQQRHWRAREGDSRRGGGGGGGGIRRTGPFLTERRPQLTRMPAAELRQTWSGGVHATGRSLFSADPTRHDSLGDEASSGWGGFRFSLGLEPPPAATAAVAAAAAATTTTTTTATATATASVESPGSRSGSLFAGAPQPPHGVIGVLQSAATTAAEHSRAGSSNTDGEAATRPPSPPPPSSSSDGAAQPQEELAEEQGGWQLPKQKKRGRRRPPHHSRSAQSSSPQEPSSSSEAGVAVAGSRYWAVVPDDDDNSASSSSDESEARERAADAIETDVTDEAGADEQEAKAGEMHSRAADDYADNVGQSMGEQAVAAQTTDQAATHGVDGFAFNFSQSDGDPADDPSSPGHTVAQVPAGDAKRRAKKARQRARKQQQRQQRRQQEQQEQQEETEERVQRQQQAVSAEKPRDFPAGVLVAWGVRQLGAAAQRSGHAAPTAAQAAAIERELRWLRATDVAEEAKLAKLEVPPAAAACRQQQQHSHARAHTHTERKRERETCTHAPLGEVGALRPLTGR
jgi:hypothetical protein